MKVIVLLLVAEFYLSATAELIKMPIYNSTFNIEDLLERPFGFEGLTYRQYFDSEGIDSFSLNRNILEDATLLTVRKIGILLKQCLLLYCVGIFSMN